ncbi:esterase/lipase family protein [Spartinivicinus poritis]|uniref:Alpha/beta hydrolase n=1 Tax=Spartinivicinus poritis TaxID=2994640 RepID=A0ABT5UHR2_9GAMM|nr:alpha/beta fold hydrolase [Spartinivicinus sp. A2-2]MDE1465893.1 alpha/beta hydrolase [Spartinivicinus sp. A2-2]
MTIRRIVLTVFFSLYSITSLSQECVVLLHGLVRTASSMEKLAIELSKVGFYVVNIDYPSRDKPVEVLAEIAVSEGLKQCKKQNAIPVNYVTHSLGGILVRQYYQQHTPMHVKRVVMLAPPNQGSEVVDNLKNVPGFGLINGPAGRQLGTDKNSIPSQLGPVNFELGVIAGTQSINLILSTFLPNPDDGKVSVERTKVEGMCGFIALPTTHPFIMSNNLVIKEVKNYLKNGKFESKSAVSSC